jgi:predicted HTH transcriptional regulator
MNSTPELSPFWITSISKRDEIQNRELAKEVVAFSNFMGGLILLGVEDDGTVHGTTRQNLEEWVMELCRAKIAGSTDPPPVPVSMRGEEEVRRARASNR